MLDGRAMMITNAFANARRFRPLIARVFLLMVYRLTCINRLKMVALEMDVEHSTLKTLQCYVYTGNAPVKLFCKHPPPGTPGDITFFGCPGPLITLLFPCPDLYNHKNYPFFGYPALFYHTHFSYDPAVAVKFGSPIK